MWQRNKSGYAQEVSAWPTDDDPTRAPFRVGVDEDIDFPELLAGFVPVDKPADEPAPKAARRKDAAAAADTKEGEPQ
jgi:hypothetical protein